VHLRVDLDRSSKELHNTSDSNLGLVLANFVFAKRCDTPCKVEKNIDLRNDLNYVRFVFQMQSNESIAFFLIFLQNIQNLI